MKLLIITQKVDSSDSNLGFFHEWLYEFSKHVDHIEVIALQVGHHTLPEHVRIHSLGKEKLVSRWAYVKNFYRLIFHLKHEYDVVFVHMNPIYVILGGIFWKRWHKKIALWYTHKQVDLKLRLAAMISDVICTASPESFRLRNRKVAVVGHGITLEAYEHVHRVRARGELLHLLTVGRITKRKNLLSILETVDALVEKKRPFELSIVGTVVTNSDERYRELLESYVTEHSLGPYVHFLGSKKPSEVPQQLFDADMLLHMSQTGSLDKIVLEAFAAGLLVISSSEAVRPLFGPYQELLFVPPNQTTLALNIEAVAVLPEEKKEEIRSYFRAYVREHHSLSSLIPNIITTLSS